MGVNTVNDTGSAWGAAFRNKPLMLKTHLEVGAFLNGKIHRNMLLNEDSCSLSTNNSYRNYTTYEVASDDLEKTFLDFGFYLTPDSKIGGLPEKAANLLNRTKGNAKIERMKDALVNIIGNIKISGDLGIPDFTSQFQFQDGAFSVPDSGFAMDTGALDERLTPHYSGNMYSDMYRYQFKRVL